MIWKITSKEDYDYGLNCLMPRVWLSKGFLVGEPYSTKTCNITLKVATTHTAFIKHDHCFYKASEPMTVEEFRRLTIQEVLGNVDLDRTIGEIGRAK